MADDPIFPGALLGRRRQLELLERLLQRAKGGEGAAVFITGEAGIGKTRLMDEMIHKHGEGVTWLRGTAHSFSQRISYWPFIEMLKAWFTLTELETQTEHWSKIKRAYSGLAPNDADQFLPYIAALLGIDPPSPIKETLGQLDADELGAQIRRAALHFLDHLSQRGPVALFFDDFQWVDDSSFELIEHLLQLVDTNSLLAVVAGRPEADHYSPLLSTARSGLEREVTEIALRPLTTRDSLLLVEGLVGNDDSTTSIRNAIAMKAEGNPFFIEEIVNNLKERQSIVRIETGFNWIAPTASTVPIPDTIQAAIIERIDRLDEHLKTVLSVASVIGRTFFYRVLRAVTPPDASLDQRLAELTSIQLLDEFRSAPELAYLFHHALAQQAVYGSLSEEDRRAIHNRVGECLEALYSDRLQEVTSILAFHYSRASNWEKAIKYLLASADYSSSIAADSEALAHYAEAVAAYSKFFGEGWDSEQRAKIELRLGQIYFRRGDRAQAFEHIALSLDLLGERLPNDKTLSVSIAREFGRMLLDEFKGLFSSYEPARSAHQRAEMITNCYEVLCWLYFTNKAQYLPYAILRILHVGREFGHAEALGGGLSSLGFTFDNFGLRRLASYYHTRARRVTEKANSSRLEAVTGMLLTTHFYLNGDWLQAQNVGLRTLHRSEKTGHLETMTDCACQICEIWCEQGEHNRALAQADKLIRLGRDSAFILALAWGLTQRGIALTRLGRFEEAETAFRECVSLAKQSHDTFMLAIAASEHAICLLRAGKIHDAEKVLKDLDDDLQISFQPVAALVHIDRARAEVAVALFEEKGDDQTRLEARSACKRLIRSARIARLGAPSSRRLYGTFLWLCGSKSRARSSWRSGISKAAFLGARLELGVINYEMSSREGQLAEAAKWKAMLAALG